MAPKRPRADLAAAAAASATASTSSDGGKRVKFAPDRTRATTALDDEAAHEEELAMGETGTSGGTRKSVVMSGYDSDSSGDEQARHQVSGNGGGADDDDDMFGDAAAATAATSKGDNDNASKRKDKKEFLEMADIEGQEFGKGDDDEDDEDDEDEDYYEEDDLANDDDAPRSKRSKDGMGYKLTSFNMKDELAEGRFQADGTYLANKRDPLAKHDAWLDGMSKQAIKQAREAKERADEQARQRELEESRRTESALAQERDDCLIGILSLIRPGETPARALARLGAKKNKNKPHPNQLHYKQKQRRIVDDAPSEDAMRVDDEEGTGKGKRSESEMDPISRDIDTLTRLTSTLLSTHGELEIYDESYEDIVKTLKSEGAVRRDWVPPRPIDDDDQDDASIGEGGGQTRQQRHQKGSLISRPSANSGTNNNSQQQQSKGADDRKFMYKWVVTPPGQPADQEHGPYSHTDLDNWVKGGFFGENGNRIMIKTVDNTSGQEKEWQSWSQLV